MSKPVLSVPGIDPARIECREEPGHMRGAAGRSLI